MSDRVFIRGLELDTVIGVFDWEREVRQTLLLDLEMAWDNRPAAHSDSLGEALDYSAVADRLHELAASSDCLLIEALAERIADVVRTEFHVPWLQLRLCKPGAVARSRDVGVLIERGERGEDGQSVESDQSGESSQISQSRVGHQPGADSGKPSR